MKKLVLLLASLFLLGGCDQEFTKESSYTPTGGADYNPALDPDYKPSEGGGSSEEGGGSSEGGGGSEEGGGGSGGEVTPDVPEEEEEEEALMCTYNFYFSYSHSTKYNPSTKKDEASPILSFEAKMLEPLGAVPSQLADSDGNIDVEKVKSYGGFYGFTPDPAFPKFMGFSFHGLCLDSSDIWDFTKDFKQQAVVSLYGIWYSDAI